MPLDYAGPRSVRPGPRTPTAVEWLVVFGVILLLVAIVLPSLNSPRIGSVRVACSANLRSLGQALHMYAAEHRGALPVTVDTVVAERFLPDVRILLCPDCEDTPAKGVTPAALAADVTAGGHLSYVYVGRGLMLSARGDTVLAYEHAANHVDEDGKPEGGNVLFLDGHVEWHDAAELRAVIDWHAAGNGPAVMVRELPSMLRPSAGLSLVDAP